MTKQYLIYPFVAGCIITQILTAGNSQASGTMVPVLTIDPSCALIIQSDTHEIGEFDRDRYFRTYHFPGLHSEARNAELIELGAVPGRGTGPSFGVTADPLTDANAKAGIERVLNRWNTHAERAQRNFPDLPYAMAGGGSGMPQPWKPSASVDRSDVDATMRIMNTLAIAPEYYESAAGLVADWLKQLNQEGRLAPVYYSSINEPDAGWRIQENRIGTFIDYHRVLAETLRAEAIPIRITGPCTAWGFPRGDFSRWENGWEGRFIDEAGDTVDAYDFHFYSKGYWAFVEGDNGWNPALQQDSPSLFATRKTGVGTIWEFGRLDAFLDMVASRHIARWGGTAPTVIVSEFGRQGISKQLGPWENDFKSLLYMNTVIRMWMTFFQRPEIELTVPFILAESDIGYGSTRGQALYTRPGYPEDRSLIATPFVEFYKFFTNLDGERVLTQWEDGHKPEAVFSLALRDNNLLYVLIHNGDAFGTQSEVIIQSTDAAELIATDAIRWSGVLPERVDPEPEGELIFGTPEHSPRQEDDSLRLTIGGEETILLTLKLAADVPISSVVRQRSTYSPLLLQRVTANEVIALEIPPLPSAAQGKRDLVLGIASPKGFQNNLTLSDGKNWNHSVNLSSSEGVTDYHSTITIPIPDTVTGSIRIALEDGGILSSAKWVSHTSENVQPHAEGESLK